MSRIRTMLVDDNASLRQMVREYLSNQAEIEVVAEAANGVEALEVLPTAQVDLVILDIVMPRMDGLGVLSELRAQGLRPRVVMLTALRGEEIIMRAMELGADYFLIKPVDLDILHRRIIEVCEVRRAEASASLPMPEAAAFTRWSPEERVSNLFLSIGIPAHIKGYQYLREAVRMVIEDHGVINRITKELYPGIARRFGTSSSKVERAMRHAIEVAWNRGRLDNTNQMLGCAVFSARDKPTNGEFIALIADQAKGV